MGIKITFLFPIIALAACSASTAQVSEMYKKRLIGITGCESQEIRLDYKSEPEGSCGDSNAFEATCKEKTFVCSSSSAVSGGATGHPALDSSFCSIELQCKEKDRTQQPTSENGCRYDTQCKGDRVCTGGKCVSPE